MVNDRGNDQSQIPNPRGWIWLVISLALAVAIGVGLTAVRYWTLSGLQARANERLALYLNSLDGQLKRFEYLPSILSANDSLASFLRGEGEAADREWANRYLEQVKHESGAAEIFVMDADGTTQASSNWRSELSFVGRSYRFRPYFQQAIQGRLGRYFAIGATTGIPGGFFARAVRDGVRTLGVVVVKIDLDELQNAWSVANENVLVSDGNGVVFLSSRPDWRYRSLGTLPNEVLQRLAVTRQYAGRPIDSLGRWRVGENAGEHFYEISRRAGVQTGSGVRYLENSRQVPGFDWVLHVLMDLSAVDNAMRQALVVSLLVGGLVVVGVLYMRQRRAHLRSVELARDELEHRVLQRTHALESANRSLRSEIKERERAEQELRTAQVELIQASKLAAMGKMAAVIVHELNQPLDAIRTFAASAGVLATKHRGEELQDTLDMIHQLTTRMEKITGQLRSFARKDSGERQPVSVSRMIERALLLMDNRLHQAQVGVEVSLPEGELCIGGEATQLEQVMINLTRNALDAMAQVSERHLRIAVQARDDRVSITVTDTGTGIPDEAMPHLFEPFYSTKREGDDLGLGLAFCYSVITGYGGTIRAFNNDNGGAGFEVNLAACDGTDPEE